MRNRQQYPGRRPEAAARRPLPRPRQGQSVEAREVAAYVRAAFPDPALGPFVDQPVPQDWNGLWEILGEWGESQRPVKPALKRGVFRVRDMEKDQPRPLFFRWLFY